MEGEGRREGKLKGGREAQPKTLRVRLWPEILRGAQTTPAAEAAAEDSGLKSRPEGRSEARPRRVFNCDLLDHGLDELERALQRGTRGLRRGARRLSKAVRRAARRFLCRWLRAWRAGQRGLQDPLRVLNEALEACLADDEEDEDERVLVLLLRVPPHGDEEEEADEEDDAADSEEDDADSD